jgi:hypothetical protein
MARVLRNVAGTVVMIVLTHASAWAQATGQMSGTVRDASGAVLPGVTITVTQTDTGFTRTVVTEGGGTYVVPNLPTGPYKLEASLQGFRSYSQTGIVLQVNGNPTINVTLAIGDVAETIRRSTKATARRAVGRSSTRRLARRVRASPAPCCAS